MNKQKMILAILACFVFILTCSVSVPNANATTFIATQNGTWDDPATWGGLDSPTYFTLGDNVTIPAGMAVMIPNNVLVTNAGGILSIFGILENNGTIRNTTCCFGSTQGIIINNPGGIFSNNPNGTIINDGILELNSNDTVTFSGPSTYSGSFSNTGTLTSTSGSASTLWIQGGTTFIIKSGTFSTPFSFFIKSPLLVKSGATLLNTAFTQINPGVTIYNNGTITNTAQKFYNFGFIDNTNVINNYRNAAFYNENIITDFCGSTFNNHGSLNGDPPINVCDNTISSIKPIFTSAFQGITSSLMITVNDTSNSTTAPTGKITWNDGGAGGTFNLNPCTLNSLGSNLSSCNNITYTAPLTIGLVKISATYSGDPTHAISIGTAKVSVIALRTTKTSVSPNPASVILGSGITFAGKVSDSSNGTKISPTGTLIWNDGGMGGSFKINGLPNSICDLSISSCKISYNPPSSVAGTIITINSTYSGDTAHSTSSGTSKLTILRSTSLSMLPNSKTVTPGSSQVYIVKISDISSGTTSAPTGTISWNASVSGGSFNSGTCILSPINMAQSKCQVIYSAPTTAETLTITGTYNGDNLHAKSSGKATLTVS